jgi:hypothetical protein
MPLLSVIIHPFQLPAGCNLTRPKKLHLKTTIIARLSILILNKTYPTKVTSRHVGLLASGFVLPKSN